jgi:hypothetical protein
MAGQLIPRFELKDPALFKEASTSYRLILQMSREEFSYCIADAALNKYLCLFSYDISGIHDDHHLANLIASNLEENPLLKQPFSSVMVVYESPRTTLVPAGLFAEEDKGLVAGFTHDLGKDDVILAEKLPDLEACNIFTIPQVLMDMLGKSMPPAIVRSHTGALIEAILLHYKNRPEYKRAFVNVRRRDLDILLTEGKKLLFSNTFRYATPEDFGYFVLFVFEQLKLNPEETELVLLGDIPRLSRQFGVIHPYIRNIRFGERNNFFSYSYLFDEVPAHAFYTLLNASLCEL